LWLWLAEITEGNNKLEKKILDNCGEPEIIYKMSDKEILGSADFTEYEKKILQNNLEKVSLDRIKDDLKAKEVNFVSAEHEEFPSSLRAYQDCPFHLYYKGRLPADNTLLVAVVGSRVCSNYGRNIAKNLGRELSENDISIISGMARGIDTYSHLGAVEIKKPTFAVLGCGVDICYPTENIELYRDIISYCGGIISEYPCGTKPLSWNFPLRNRIISGMSDAVVVVEAKEKSGSLITVEYALEQGKDVFAVPGRVGDVLSEGCNRLIKSGAMVLTEPSDILQNYGISKKTKCKISALSKKNLEKDLLLVYIELGLHPVSVQTIIEETRLEYEKIMELLTKLQLMGLVEEVYQNHYARTK